MRRAVHGMTCLHDVHHDAATATHTVKMVVVGVRVAVRVIKTVIQYYPRPQP